MRNLNNGRRHPYGSKKKKHGCLIEDFRHDKSTIKGRCPLINPKREKHEDKRERSKITRRKSLRVVTPEASIIPLSLIPEWLYRPIVRHS